MPSDTIRPMSITIRLSRVGKKNAPAYKIVVMNTRDKRYGRFLDIIGHYNPSQNPESFALNEDKYKEWVGKGADVTKAVEDLKNGTYVHKPYAPHKKNQESVNTEPSESAETSDVADATEEVEKAEEVSEEA